jgi:hypothetical protein
LFGVKSSSLSRSSSLRREERKQSFLSAQSAGIERQIDEDVNSLRLEINHQVWRWERKYLLLKQFNDREGHCRVPYSHQEDEANLGTWANRQRHLKTKDELDSDRTQRLEDIGFEWVLYSAKWDEMHALLKQFKKREGHCKVPQMHREDGVQLGQWVKTQRHLKTKDKLDPNRQTRLEEIGLEWVFASGTWDEIYALLQQFKKREGHCKVPQLHKEDEANLGTWVNTQRQLKTKEQLDPARQKQLEEIGFEWVLFDATWDEMCALLKQYKKREGHYNVPQSHTEDEANLGTWVTTQRQLKRKEKLDSGRKMRLEEIGFEWGLPTGTWDEMYALLQQFKQREGHCKVPRSHKEDEANLGNWVGHQRQLKTRGKLIPDRQKRLDKIGFNWAGPARLGLSKTFEQTQYDLML